MTNRLALLALVTGSCLSCGVADQVDEVVVASRAPQAAIKPRACPQFGSWLMLPKTPRVGIPAELRVNVSDLDSPPDALSFEWRAESGQFSEPSGTQTSFTCEREGYQTVTLVARDETDCARHLDILVACFPR